MTKPLALYNPLFAWAMLALVSLACGSASGTRSISTPTPWSASTVQVVTGQATDTIEPPTPIPTDVSTTEAPAFLGDLIEVDGYSLTAFVIEDPATRPGVFYKSQPGKKLVAVEFAVGNISGETFNSNVLYTTLVDTDGFLYGAEIVGVEGDLELLDVNPGERVRGWAAFFIPEGAKAAKLKYEIKNTVLETGLLPR